MHPVGGIEKCRALAFVGLGSGSMCLLGSPLSARHSLLGLGWGWGVGGWEEGSKVPTSLFRCGHLTSVRDAKSLELSL